MSVHPVTLALIGAGNRGAGIFGHYALEYPHKARFVAIVERDAEKREAFARAHGVAPELTFDSVEAFFAKGERYAEGLILATPESDRLDILKAAMKAEYAILTEKPLATSLEESLRITDLAAGYSGLFMVCHQLRYVPLYANLKRLITSGEYGGIVAFQHSENLAYSHMAHSFVRGYFNSTKTSPMILSKSCHDMDIISYLMGKKPVAVASFGSLVHFRKENAPARAPARCLDGCPAEASCPYHVSKLYLNNDGDEAYIRQMGVVRDRVDLLERLKTNRFGRCVYQCDNDVVDQQSVTIEFEDGVAASFTMCGHNGTGRRMTKISLTGGELACDTSKEAIEIASFEPRTHSVLRPSGLTGTHGGGDRIIMEDFTAAIARSSAATVLTPVSQSLTSHLLAFAAEEARVTKQVIRLDEFEKATRAKAGLC